MEKTSNAPSQFERPKLTVCVVSYNHEKYIEQCLQSILTQETDFEFEVIIGDDNSSDATVSTIRNVIKGAPVKVTLINRQENIGALKNLIEVHQSAKGQYIAHIDGDDIMLPSKLQKQVQFLDENPDCSIVWHGVVRFQDESHEGALNFRYSSNRVEKYGMRDLILFGPLGNHSSSMYRNGTRSFQYESKNIIDWRIYEEDLSRGSGALMHEVLGAYRVNVPNSLTNGENSKRVRGSMASSLNELSKKYPQYRREFFFAALYRAIIERRGSFKLLLAFFSVAVKNLSFVSPREFRRTIGLYKDLLQIRFHDL